MKRNTDISFVINLFVLERMAHRLSLSDKTGRFLIFKGGLVSLFVYQSNRFTVDLDALVQGFDIMKAEELVVPVLVDDIGDGVWFVYHGQKLLAGQTDYAGLQLVFRGGIGFGSEEV
ncbi:MAG: nucleotidyl transferase AbiEii/AbiGii toxin family protein [Deltaproteobacteria bacterium]|nr:nucleotidyl transferase AbiEii/AbiGii toxin family protein [Deltaproteobacteria bacterium]